MKLKLMGSFLSFLLKDQIVAITLAPFGVYFKNLEYLKNSHVIVHESIHWKQQLEMGILLFYIWYGLEWLIKLIFYGREAYYRISFEVEAYYNDEDEKYLSKRKHYAWLKYI